MTMPHDDIITTHIYDAMIYSNFFPRKHIKGTFDMSDNQSEMEFSNDILPDAPANESKAAKFKRLATHRLTNVRKAIQILSNCTNRQGYEYTPEQVAKVLSLLRNDIDELERKFNQDEIKADLSVEL